MRPQEGGKTRQEGVTVCAGPTADRLAPTIACFVSLQTTKLPQLQEHVNNKHPKNAPKDCFPSHF